MHTTADRQARLVACLEALYAWERDDEHWLRSSTRAIGALWSAAVWTSGIIYDASDADGFTVGKLLFDDNASAPVRDAIVDVFRSMPPSFVSNTYRSLTIGFGRPVGPELEPFYRRLEQHGTFDIFGVNGLDPSGRGCFVGIGAPPDATMSPEDVLVFQRVSSHLASAFRCRQRLHAAAVPAVDQAEAVLRLDGTILEAKGPARAGEARQALMAQMRSIREVRELKSDAPVERWLPRVQGRWTLVDAPGEDRDRYVLARENLSAAPALTLLTERELQVVATMSLGRTSKEAAYDLGISDATVRVLLARVYARLGVRSRQELMQLNEVRALREGRRAEQRTH